MEEGTMRYRLHILALIAAMLLVIAAACGEADQAVEEEPQPATDEEEADGEELNGLVVPEELRGGEIIVYSSFPDEQMVPLTRAFTEATDIQVRNIVMSSGEAFGRLRAEAGNPQADYWLSVRGAILQEALDHDPPIVIEYKPQTLDQVSPQYQYPEHPVFTGIGMYPLVFFYNEQVIEAEGLEVPETYDDLLDPQYQGEMLMPHPATSGTAFSALSMFIELYGDEEGWDYIERLSANMDQFTRSGRAPQNLVAQGEYALGIGFYDAVYYLRVDGFPIEPVFPEPIFGEPFSGQVVNGAPNEERAKLFHDYLLLEEPQRVFLDFGTYSVREDLPPPEGALPLTELDVHDYDWERWAEERDDILERFDQLIGAEPTE
jgi:iron(III) transport system substrate-binding protein